MSKLKLIFFLVLIILLTYGAFIFNDGWNGVSTGETAKIVIKDGDGKVEMAKALKDKNLIRSDQLFALRLASSNVLIRPGEYEIKGGQKPSEVIDEIINISKGISDKEKNAVARKTLKITIPEGKTVDEIIAILNKSGLKNADKMQDYWTKPRDEIKYDFLPKKLDCEYGNVDKCVKYYYEGYLYPSTYEIYEDASPKEITKTFLDAFNTTVFNKIGKKNADELFKIVTVASIVELETGRPGGVNSSNIKELNEERQKVARVIYNRLDAGMKIQSDPTVNYGLKQKICQQGREISGCIYLNDPLVKNSLYNTYNISGLPIGPITSPQIDSINASINPPDNDYLFFVADLTGKKYFAKTNEEHENNIYKATKVNEGLK